MDHLVQGTNDSSILSKYSMVTSGYFSDEYIKYFVQKEVKRAPLINVGYFVRAWIMHNSLTNFLKSANNIYAQLLWMESLIDSSSGLHGWINSLVKAVVVCVNPNTKLKGCLLHLFTLYRFDTTFFRLASDFNNIKYFEIDLPGVVKRKIEIIRNSEALMLRIQKENGNITVGKENEYLLSNRYCLFSHDLSLVDGLEMKLKEFGFEFSALTLLFSECAITYLEETKSTELINWSQIKFPKSVFITFEQINPDDAFGQVMVAHFNKIQSPLKSVHKYKTIQQQIQRYLSCGWDWCDGVSAMDMLFKMLPSEKLWQTLKTEPFDEFEEWHLKCCHYALIVASSSDYSAIWKNFLTHFGNSFSHVAPELLPYEWTVVPGISIERYGHTGVNVNENDFLIIGGFGNKKSKHTRMNTVLGVSLADYTVTDVLPVKQINNQEQPKWDCMYPTCTKVGYNEFILYGGRTSPSNPVNNKPWICKANWNEEERTYAIVPIVQGPTDCCLEPAARWRHSAALINPGKILIYGGLSPGLKVLDDLWLLTVSNITDLPTISWSLISSTHETTAPPPSFSHSAAVHDSAMYLSGGFNDSMQPLDHLWSYQLSNGWQEINTVPRVKPRYGHTSHITSDKKLILLGGVNISSEDQPALTVVCLNTFTVSEYKLVPRNPEAPILMVHNHISVYREEENSLYVFGGGGNCFSFGTYFNSNVASLNINNLK